MELSAANDEGEEIKAHNFVVEQRRREINIDALGAERGDVRLKMCDMFA